MERTEDVDPARENAAEIASHRDDGKENRARQIVATQHRIATVAAGIFRQFIPVFKSTSAIVGDVVPRWNYSALKRQIRRA